MQAAPEVGFSANQTSGCFPLPVQFTHAASPGSGSISSYLWDFGDGFTSTDANPQHTYSAAGNYHVSLRIINSNGCQTTLTQPSYITVAPGATAAFTHSNPTGCTAPQTIQFTNTSTGAGPLSYSWNFGDGNSAAEANPSHTYTGAGNYSVQLIVTSADGCRDTSLVPNAISVGMLNASFTAPQNICVGTPALFANTATPTPDSVRWSFGDGSVSNALNPSKTFANAGSYVVQLISFVGACKDSTVQTVTVSPNPVADFTGTPLTACAAPLSVQFSNASTGATSYRWYFGDGSSSTSINPQHTYTQPGTYTVQLVAISSQGCTDSVSKAAYVTIQLPEASINNLPQQGCAPFTHQFAATITSLDPVVSYLWNFGDGNTSTSANPTHTFAAGVYDITLIITTAGGCKDTVTRVAGIRASTKPVAAFSASPGDVCAFNDVNFTDESTGTVNSWLWNFGDGGSSTSQHPVYNYSDTGFFNVQLIAGNYGCYDTIRLNNYIHVKPPIAVFETAMNCDTPFLRRFTDASIGADEWHWNFGDGNMSTMQNTVHTYNAAGTYTVTLTVRNASSRCEHTSTQTVVVANEAANFSASQTVLCRQQATTFTAVQNNSGGIAQYNWLFGDGSSGTGNPVTHTYSSSGNYDVQLIITDVAGCSDTLRQSNYIRVNGPVANFGTDAAGSCLLTAIQFHDSSTTDGVNDIRQWSWQFGDGTGAVLHAPNAAHTYASAGQYSVMLMVEDAAGCKDSVLKTNLLVISSPQAAFSTADTAACPGSAVQFTNNSTGPGLTYFWDFGDGHTSTAANPSHIYQQNGQYSVRLEIQDQYGCRSQMAKANYISVVTPVASFTVNDSVGTCPPLIVQFTDHSSNQQSYSWNFGDGSTSSAASPSHFYNIAGTYFATLTVTGPGGCTSIKTQKIVVSGPKGSFSYQNRRGCSPLTVSFAASSIGTSSFVWDFNDGTSIVSNDSSVTHTYTVPGIYVPKMILKDAAGCTVPITGADTIVVADVTAAFTADTLLHCSNGNVEFTNTTLSNDLITGYTWLFGDGSTATQQSPTHFYAAEGNY
ncbi:MAG: PKD domain-containing protein, partial [Sphingobacteriales bacterium]